jgi:predicted amino acid-binding ACT domain protein
MAIKIRRVSYFHTTVKDRPGEAFKILSSLAQGDVNLLAFGAVPLGPDRAQLTLFPEHVDRLAAAAEQLDLVLEDPRTALLVQGDDKLGAFAGIHAKLYECGINIYSSNGVTDGKGSYGYVLYIHPDQIEEAAAALGA